MLLAYVGEYIKKSVCTSLETMWHKNRYDLYKVAFVSKRNIICLNSMKNEEN